MRHKRRYYYLIIDYIKMSKKPTHELFITISKEQRGSLLEPEIDQSINAIKKILKEHTQLLIVKEFRDRYARDFVHLHCYAKITKARTPEAVKRSFIPHGNPTQHLLFYQHPKDLDVTPVTDDKQLIAGYFMKSSDYEILHNTFPDEYIEECKQHLKMTQVKFKTNLIRNQRQTSANEIPFLFKQYIEDTNFPYDCTSKSFSKLYIEMFKTQKYALPIHFKNLKSIKLHLDLLQGTDTHMEKHILSLFEDLDLEIQNKF